MSKLKKSDFECNSDDVARDILGRNLSIESPDGITVKARIREVGAYEGSASKTSKKIKSSAGIISISTKYGHKLLDIATGRVGESSCVTLRAIDLEGITIEGPGNVTRSLGIDKSTWQLYDGIPVYKGHLCIDGERVDESEIYEKIENSPNCKGIYRF
jgi:3-methyladenine DNA glycosylase Mpg